MPPGGDGYYYFSAYFLLFNGEGGRFAIKINGEVLCFSLADQEETPGDGGQAVCSAATYATEGWSIDNNFRICHLFWVFG